jgi:dihydrofolate synthase / folylpolyglutamate synthase
VDYRESLDFLYGLQRFGIKLGLENIQALLDNLDHPERSFGIVHVAGTNGKGSVCATLAQILTCAGIRTGLYTSPHLHSFTERIRIDGEAISEEDVASLSAAIRIRTTAIPSTFFEFTTALALEYFRRKEVKTAVLEVGMGGRLDATNAVIPQVTVITPVSRDHVAHLGESLREIASEKGGIIKKGVPVVIARQHPEVLKVLLTMAHELHAPVLLSGRDFSCEAGPGELFSYFGPEVHLRSLHPGLPGRHQHENISVALTAAGLLRRHDYEISEGAMRSGVGAVRWPGRLEWWGGVREILLDGAHNEGGARVLAEYLETLPVAGVRWVAGVKGDKLLDEILGPLLPRVSALYATRPPVESTTPPDDLVRAAHGAGIPAASYPDPEAALTAALEARRPGEIVLVAGSLFLVAAAREYLLRTQGVAA